ncbi:MAG TPA: hypothetical protein VGI95_21575 [Caulobacteraceae bacterium]
MIEVDDDLARRLRVAADAAGESVERYALMALKAAADDDWAEDCARVAEFEATGHSIPADQAMADFRTAVEARFAKK